MNFEDITSDIKKLVGKKLSSIRKGAEIKIIEVNENEGKIFLLNKSGTKISRSLSELRKIWDALCTKPAVHVDSLMGGSGTSRNQPETIFANLPYIAVLYIDGKKHIALQSTHTHDYGTISMMDPIQAQRVRQRLTALSVKEAPPSVLVVVDDFIRLIQSIEKATGVQLVPVLPGIYKFYKAGTRALIVSSNLFVGKLKPSIYLVVIGTGRSNEPLNFEIDGYELFAIRNSPIDIIAAEELY